MKSKISGWAQAELLCSGLVLGSDKNVQRDQQSSVRQVGQKACPGNAFEQTDKQTNRAELSLIIIVG